MVARSTPHALIGSAALALLLGCPSEPAAPVEAPAAPAAAAPAAPAEAAPAKAAAEGPASAPATASAHGAASKPAVTKVHGLPNVSGLAYADPTCDGRAPCVCRGTITHGHNALAKIGVTAEHLAEGVRCVFADVDGNGYADAAVLGAEWRPDGPAQPAVVLLYDVDGLRSTAALPKRMSSVGRARAKGRDVLVEPAAKAKYHFVLSDSGRFDLSLSPVD